MDNFNAVINFKKALVLFPNTTTFVKYCCSKDILCTKTSFSIHNNPIRPFLNMVILHSGLSVFFFLITSTLLSYDVQLDSLMITVNSKRHCLVKV